MRILFVVEHFPCISETFVLNQVTGLLDLGHDVTIYAIGKQSGIGEHPAIRDYKLMDRTWVGISSPTSKMHRIINAMRFFPPLFSRCGFKMFKAFDVFRHGKHAINLGFFYSCLPLIKQDTHFDIIHCHFGDKGLLALAWREMGLITGAISTVFHAHELAGLSDTEGRSLYGPLFKSDTLLLPISKRWQQRLVSWGAKPDRTLVHHMGIDLEQFSFVPNYPQPNAAIKILSVGRLTEQKGFIYAIQAVARLITMTDREVEYIIVGAGELESELKQLVADLKITQRVNFVGSQTQDAVHNYLKQAHIFLLPSVTAANGFQEGIPVALMEAMAIGIPVVTTNHSGIPELVEDNVSGFLAEEKEVLTLAEAMFKLLSNPDLANKVVINAREKVKNEFDIKQLNKNLEAIFNQESCKTMTL